MSLSNDNSNNKNGIISVDPRFFNSAPELEPDNIQNIYKNFEGIKDEDNESEEINGIENVNQNAFDIFKENQGKEEEVTKTKKRRKLSSLEGNGKHKSNLTENKNLPNKKKNYIFNL